MNDSKKQVLIVDNATTCAMRIKTLVNIHGAIAKIIHWSDWEHFLQQSSDLQPCLVVVEETVPRYVIESIVEHLPTPPFFLLINTHSKVKDWGLNKPINPLLSSLSNFEIIALLEPYWSEEKSISLPSVLILDDNPTTSFKINEDLSEANIPCRVSNRIESAYLNDIDMLLVNMSELDKRQRQIVKVKAANPSVGVITYCESSNIADIKFVQFALNHQLDLALTIEQLNGAWVAEFYRVWRQKAESRDRQLVAEQVESSLDKLLEKSLVMQVLFANSMDGVVSFTEDGQILRFNNGFCELIGVLQEQFVDENIFNWLPLQSRHELEELLLGEHLIQQQVLDLQVRHEHNINIPVSVAINKINFHGQFVYVAVMRNNTSQQLQKKLLVQQNAQLVHKTKELKRQQEINGELTRKNERKKNAFMLSFTNYLAANSSEQSLAIQNRIANVQQYFRLQTRQEQCVQKPLMLKTELEMLIQDQAKAIEQAGVKVKVNLNKSLQVVFDQEHLYKVFEELLVNAIQFSLKGGKIEFVQSLITDTHVEIAVNDTGIGILEHKQLQLFDIYELNSANKKELSTGLPLAKALVQANRGEIYVDNHYDQDEVIGSVFRVKLPTK